MALPSQGVSFSMAPVVQASATEAMGEEVAVVGVVGDWVVAQQQ
jgi:hypothetical protein